MVNIDIDEVVGGNLTAFKVIMGVLEAKYQSPVTTPGMSVEDIMYQAGQYSVLLHFREVIARVESNLPLG